MPSPHVRRAEGTRNGISSNTILGPLQSDFARTRARSSKESALLWVDDIDVPLSFPSGPPRLTESKRTTNAESELKRPPSIVVRGADPGKSICGAGV